VLTREQKLALLHDLQKHITASREMMERVFSVFGCHPDGPFQESTWELHGIATSSVALLLGDTLEMSWLEWFIYENNWGADGREAGYDGDVRPIRTFEDLLDLIDKENAA